MGTEMPGRMLRLLSLLQSRREWSGAELAQRLGVTGRTVRRDVERLRELGYPVTGTTGSAGGYRLASGRNLPPLLLDDDEAVAIAVGLRTAADTPVAGIEEAAVRALAKLEQVLPPRLRQRVASVGRATVGLPRRGGPPVDADLLAELATACRDREVVVFEYRGRGGAASSRRVEPYHLVTGYGLWYLIGYDLHRADWRTFRLDRLTELALVRRRFDPRELPAASPAAMLRRSISEAPYRYSARATVAISAETVQARVPTLLPAKVTARGTAEHGGRAEVALAADSLDRVVQDLVALDAEFELADAPPELLDHLDTVAERLRAASARARSK
jgi:predicted DNA-binding transcriptional regulator YafY